MTQKQILLTTHATYASVKIIKVLETYHEEKT